MTPTAHLRRSWNDFAAAMQFLTRIPTPALPYEVNSLARSTKFFPLIGGIVGAGASLLHLLLAPHLPRPVAAFFVLVYLVLVTGGLHEDGFADAADGFGGGVTREKTLLIFRDSRIGSYGGMALVFSLMGRLLLLTSLSLTQVPYYLLAACVLCRWTILPLSYFLPSARMTVSPEVATPELDGQGARIARQITIGTLIGGTIFSFAVALVLLRHQAAAAILSVIIVTWLTGIYYRRRIAGITGDCFGATIQLAEISIYLCGAWTS